MNRPRNARKGSESRRAGESPGSPGSACSPKADDRGGQRFAASGRTGRSASRSPDLAADRLLSQPEGARRSGDRGRAGYARGRRGAGGGGGGGGPPGPAPGRGGG